MELNLFKDIPIRIFILSVVLISGIDSEQSEAKEEIEVDGMVSWCTLSMFD
jgi:hypothetical protein